VHDPTNTTPFRFLSQMREHDSPVIAEAVLKTSKSTSLTSIPMRILASLTS
jgi:hypothetical protein